MPVRGGGGVLKLVIIDDSPDIRTLVGMQIRTSPDFEEVQCRGRLGGGGRPSWAGGCNRT